MKEKRKVLERSSTVSGKNRSAIAWLHLYSDCIILIKRQATWCPLCKTATEDWPLPGCEEPFRPQTLSGDQADHAGNRKLLFASVTPAPQLLTGCLLARWRHHAPRRTPCREGPWRPTPRPLSPALALESPYAVALARCGLRLQQSQAAKDRVFNSNRITECSGLEGTSVGHLLQPPTVSSLFPLGLRPVSRDKGAAFSCWLLCWENEKLIHTTDFPKIDSLTH